MLLNPTPSCHPFSSCFFLHVAHWLRCWFICLHSQLSHYSSAGISAPLKVMEHSQLVSTLPFKVVSTAPFGGAPLHSFWDIWTKNTEEVQNVIIYNFRNNTESWESPLGQCICAFFSMHQTKRYTVFPAKWEAKALEPQAQFRKGIFKHVSKACSYGWSTYHRTCNACYFVYKMKYNNKVCIYTQCGFFFNLMEKNGP